MASLTSSELEEVFIDVRKAYRLIYLYQQRILDTVEYVSSILSQTNIEGWVLFGDAFKNSKNIDFNRSAWDWIPMYCYEFKFAPQKIKGNSYDFALAAYADNGFENAEDGVSPTQVERFVPPERSESQIYLYVGKNMWKPENFEVIWTDKYPREFEFIEDNKHFLSLRFAMSRFKNEESIIEALKEFKAYCNARGMVDFLEMLRDE